MGENSKIEWCDHTWNPTTGYAATMTTRLAAMGHVKYQGLTGRGHFNGALKTWVDELQKPLRWKKPRLVFVNSMSDLFHKDVPFEFIDRVFAVMALTFRHTYQIFTKRPERMAEYFTVHLPEKVRGYWHGKVGYLADVLVGNGFGDGAAKDMEPSWFGPAWLAMRKHYYPACVPAQSLGDSSLSCPWPLPNVWLGASCEDQATADERVPYLLRCPAAVRFVSAEPLLGSLELRESWLFTDTDGGCPICGEIMCDCGTLDWLICGGESGPHARPMHPDWVRSLRDQCVSDGVPFVPFFFKQWGEWAPRDESTPNGARLCYVCDHGPRKAAMVRVGKKNAGRLLDGREWNEFPRGAETGSSSLWTRAEKRNP